MEMEYADGNHRGRSVMACLCSADSGWRVRRRACPTEKRNGKRFVEYLEIKRRNKGGAVADCDAPFGAGRLQILNIVANSDESEKAMCSWSSTGRPQSNWRRTNRADVCGGGDFAGESGSELKEEQDLTMWMKAKFDTEKAKLDAASRKFFR